MEFDELKATWQILEKALERGNQLSVAMLRQQKLDATHRSLRPLRWNQAFQIFIGVLFILLAALLWSTKPAAIPVILAGVAVQAYGIGCIITAGIVFASLGRIDYAAPVVQMQAGLAQVRRAYGICVVVAGLSWWFMWIPLLVLLAALANINLYGHAPSVIWIGIAIGVVGLSGTYGMYLYSLKSSNKTFRQFVERATFGTSLQNAVQQLNEVRGFEEAVVS
jgi:drug/metabolite transporter (DMT)-like permease